MGDSILRNEYASLKSYLICINNNDKWTYADSKNKVHNVSFAVNAHSQKSHGDSMLSIRTLCAKILAESPRSDIGRVLTALSV